MILALNYRLSISTVDIMQDEVLRHLLLGFMRLHVLYHTAKAPTCGADLMEELEHHGYRAGPGTLYPMLHDLLEAGHLSRFEEVIDGKRRKNYRATAKGKRLLAAARGKIRELVSEIVDDRDALAARKKKSTRS
jgi:DNA-binding PadR family transcriptional regulator